MVQSLQSRSSREQPTEATLPSQLPITQDCLHREDTVRRGTEGEEEEAIPTVADEREKRERD
jgi:hypothetical protein